MTLNNHYILQSLIRKLIKYLLNKMSKNDYVETADYYALYGTLDGKLKILNSLYTNFHKNDHIDESNKIEKLLEI